MTFKDRVLQKEFMLNDTDDSIIEYINEHIDEIENISIQEIAKSLYIAPNAVMRLSKKLGYKGFAELKSLIKLEETHENEDVPKLLSNSIMKTLDLIDFKKLESVCHKMMNAKVVRFIGVGDSLYYCQMMVDNLRAVGKEAETYNTYREIDYRLCRSSDKDVVIVISASGENNRLCDMVNKAKENGAFVVTITHFHRCSLSEIANIPIYFWGEPSSFNGYSLTDRTGMMILLRELSEEFWKIFRV